MTLTASEFLRRFCQHVLPRGFVRIRHFGYLANARRAALIALARQQLACQPPPASHPTNSPKATWRCPRCGANMLIGPNLTAQQLAFRCDIPDTSLIPTLYTDQRRCGTTSKPTCVASAKLPPYSPFLLACNSRDYSQVRINLPCCPIQPGSSSLFAPPNTGQFAYLAP